MQQCQQFYSGMLELLLIQSNHLSAGPIWMAIAVHGLVDPTIS